jgi:transposase
MHSTLAKYALSLDTNSDIYSPKWRPQLLQLVDTLPEETGRCMHQELELLELVQDHINQLEARIKQRIKLTHSMQLVQTLPGVGAILATVITLEIGTIDRFCAPKHFASYCGLVPKVSASGGHVHYGRMVTPSRCPSGSRPTTTSSGLSSKPPM